ncbi:hypothetical protein [Halosimplex pelagicum]|uniref:Uncharacterized protein n=1 Tax=Halosimplex pelagicum TaxID=869886 RepID=A0A7D5TR95_9EURY|nr:hypothetical protein [Halosimplex pelagicum]QLH81112.1 hypothetical protein HZS54_05425 [Halosimplex pelagicum]
MDDSAALRLTLRRCTAVVVVGLGLIAANTHPYDPSNSFGYLLAYLAVGYLALSLLVGFVRRGVEPADSARGSSSGGDGGGSDDDSADGGDPEPDEGGDSDDPDRPPATTVGGEHW